MSTQPNPTRCKPNADPNPDSKQARNEAARLVIFAFSGNIQNRGPIMCLFYQTKNGKFPGGHSAIDNIADS